MTTTTIDDDIGRSIRIFLQENFGSITTKELIMDVKTTRPLILEQRRIIIADPTKTIVKKADDTIQSTPDDYTIDVKTGEITLVPSSWTGEVAFAVDLATRPAGKFTNKILFPDKRSQGLEDKRPSVFITVFPSSRRNILDENEPWEGTRFELGLAPLATDADANEIMTVKSRIRRVPVQIDIFGRDVEEIKLMEDHWENDITHIFHIPLFSFARGKKKVGTMSMVRDLTANHPWDDFRRTVDYVSNAVYRELGEPITGDEVETEVTINEPTA